MTSSSYKWNQSFILPHESPWSICEKYKYFNWVTLAHAFGPKAIYNHGHINMSSPENGYNPSMVIYQTGTAYKAGVIDTLGISKDEEFIGRYAPQYKYGDEIPPVYARIRYCPECMRNGYHSYYHQLIGEDMCFIHGIPLVNTEMEYSLDGYYNQYAYHYNDKDMADVLGVGSPKQVIESLGGMRELIDNAEVPGKDILGRHIYRIRGFIPAPGTRFDTYKNIMVNEDGAAERLRHKLDYYADILKISICSYDYYHYKPTVEESRKMISSDLAEYLPYALYMEKLIKYDKSDVRGKAFCLDKGEKPEADDTLAFILQRIKLMWALTDYQSAYDYHACRPSYTGGLKNWDTGIGLHRWITGDVMYTYYRPGTRSCDPFDLLVIVEICELYNEYIFDRGTSLENTMPLMVVKNFSNHVEITLVIGNDANKLSA